MMTNDLPLGSKKHYLRNFFFNIPSDGETERDAEDP